MSFFGELRKKRCDKEKRKKKKKGTEENKNVVVSMMEERSGTWRLSALVRSMEWVWPWYFSTPKRWYRRRSQRRRNSILRLYLRQNSNAEKKRVIIRIQIERIHKWA